MDFKLTADGDLSLGQQLTDEEGYLLYYKIDPNGGTRPILTRDTSEATVGVFDIETIHGEEADLQLIHSRLRTDNPDWYLYQNVGASLSDFVGEVNTPETAQTIEGRVQDTLTRNGAFDAEDLTIHAVPTGPNHLLVDVILDSTNRYIRYAFSLDFNVGINDVYVLDRNGQAVSWNDTDTPDVNQNTQEEGAY